MNAPVANLVEPIFVAALKTALPLAFGGPDLGLIIIIVLAIVLFKTIKQSRKHTYLTRPRLCPRCATPNPHHARFCRQCGQEFSG